MLHFYTNIKQFYNKMTFVLRVAGNILTRTEKQKTKTHQWLQMCQQNTYLNTFLQLRQPH